MSFIRYSALIPFRDKFNSPLLQNSYLHYSSLNISPTVGWGNT